MFKVPLPALVSIKIDSNRLKNKRSMNGALRRGFPLFELTLIIALGLIGWVAFKLYEITPQKSESNQLLADLKNDYFQISETVQSNLNELNGILTNYFTSRDPGEKELFQARCRDFNQWLKEEKARWKPSAVASVDEVATPSNKASQPLQIQDQMAPLLLAIENHFRNYQNAATYLMNNAGQPLIKERVLQREQGLQRAKSRLLGFSRQALMKGQMTELFLNDVQENQGTMAARFQNLKFALLLALVGLSFLFMLAIYRRKLAQSHRIIIQQTVKQAEQQDKLAKLDHFGRLAKELAHEIKQPLTAITARAYTLQKLIPPGADALKDVAIIRNEIKRLDNIVKDFLEFARPADPNLVPLAAERALEEIRDLMGSQLEQEEISLVIDCEENFRLMGDEQQLKQVLINLVRNAAESFEGSGTITLRARKAVRRLHGEMTEAIILEVEDTGSGIPFDIQNKIFDPFFSTKQDGTGLGLAIAAGIVDKQGGNLEFESEPGKGTIFRIVMPAATQNQMHEQSVAH